MTTSPEVTDWVTGLDDVMGRIAARSGRSEPRRRATAYLRGLLSPTERKNGWQLAEAAGDRTPDGMQEFLWRTRWDADAVQDDLQAYVVEQFGDADGVPVLDETGFLKKGKKSAGVARQYSGTAGWIENSQIGVFLGYASRHGRVLLDRALYRPKDWAKDRRRRATARRLHPGQRRGLSEVRHPLRCPSVIVGAKPAGMVRPIHDAGLRPIGLPPDLP